MLVFYAVFRVLFIYIHQKTFCESPFYCDFDPLFLIVHFIIPHSTGKCKGVLKIFSAAEKFHSQGEAERRLLQPPISAKHYHDTCLHNVDPYFGGKFV